MLGRRRAVALIASAVLVSIETGVRAEPDPARAAEFIRQAGMQLANVVGDASTPDEKRRRLQPFIDRVVDVDGVARFCLGRFWRQATPEQQREYIALFHRVLMNNVVARMGDYRQTKVSVIIGRPESRDGNVHVPTTVQREGMPAANVVWLVGDESGSLRILDVMAEGTSLRLSPQRLQRVSLMSQQRRRRPNRRPAATGGKLKAARCSAACPSSKA
jgi:phospholipid transport system substrate-binding protein